MMNNYNSLSSRFGTWLKNGIGDSGGSPPTSRSKTSWLVMLLLLLTVSVGHRTWAQSLANYSFATNATGSLALDKDSNTLDMSTGTTELAMGASVLPNSVYNDDYATSVTTLPFNFVFMGNLYDRFSANSNGQFKLGNAVNASPISGTNVSSPSLSTAILAPLTGDNAIQSDGKVHFKVFGSAPNRVFVFEWVSLRVPFSSTLGTGSRMQLRLYETSNVVEYVYGTMYNNSTSTVTRTVALSSSNTATTSNYIASIVTTPANTASTTWTTSTFPLSANMTNLHGAADGSRRVFRWTPNTTTVSGTVDNLTFTAVSLTTTTVNFVDNTTNEAGVLVTRATDAGFTQNAVSTVRPASAGTGTSLNCAQTGLVPGTTYYYKVESFVEGGMSAALTGSQATTSAATYYWTGTTGGTWSSG